MGNPTVTMASRDLERSNSRPQYATVHYLENRWTYYLDTIVITFRLGLLWDSIRPSVRSVGYLSDSLASCQCIC